MAVFTTHNDLQQNLQQVATLENGRATIINEQKLRDEVIESIVFTSVFATDEALRKECQDIIHALAQALNIIPSSTHHIYQAFGRGELRGFTVPAMNIRTLTYDTARCVFKLSMEHHIGVFIFEIARSEMGYTHQRPSEYAAVILAAAIKEGYTGPVFLQGDHFQFSKKVFDTDPQKEIASLKELIKESLDAHFCNIDIDASTLVDLSKEDLVEQQYHNYAMTAELTEYIRYCQPEGVTISVGGEIGHIGGKNSTTADFTAFMEGYTKRIRESGISKVSVQTGTSHGGTPLADGSIAEVNLDFSVLQDIGTVARSEYGLGGAVQHGASTLPNELFGEFVNVGTLEIHLATGFQNIVFDHLPQGLKEEMMVWVANTLQSERGENMNDAQFLYKLRKKAFGPFKEKLWNLSPLEKEPITTALTEQFLFLFTKLNVLNTTEQITPYLHAK